MKRQRNSNNHENETNDGGQAEHQGPLLRVCRPHGRHLPTVWTSGQRVMEIIELQRREKRATKINQLPSFVSILISLVTQCVFTGSLTKNVSLQCPQVTLHMPGTVGTGGVTGLGARFMIRLQVVRGQAIRCDEVLQINRQLHGQRTYFLPGGAFRMGVASMHRGHLTTCWSRLCVMSIMPWHTRHVTIGTAWLEKSEGTWSGPAVPP